MKQYIAVQFGARRAYAVPALLEEAGLLHAFYTDLCGNVGAGRLVAAIPTFLRNNALKRLARREAPENIRAKTVTFPLQTLRHVLRQSTGKYNTAVGDDILWEAFDTELGRAMIRRGLGQSTHIFSMAGECLPFIEHAHQQGRTVVTEFYSMPSRREIYREEWRRFPELEDEPDDAYVNWYAEKQRQVCRVTDWVIAPSQHVIDDLTENFGFPRERCFVVPYAVHESWLDAQNDPVPGRVLFVGLAGMGKGIHYAGTAQQLLNDPRIEFRVVGWASERVRKHRLCQGLNFVGFVPRSEVREEFRRADIFILPSLFEGSAEVTYEALASGLPVLTTPAAGSVVRDGIEGFIVPERDPNTLAERIRQLMEDRALRERMSAAAKERARCFTWKQYGERLQAAFEQIP